MALQTITTVDTATTDAAFRAWGSALSAKLAALGFVQTADTGQVNWTTVTHPTVAFTVAGYEIWRFNDTLQSTAPILFKIEYGTPASTAGLNLWVTVGTASDGAGTITSSASFSPSNTVATRQSLMGSANNTTGSGGTGNEYLWAESSGGGALGVLMWPSINENNFTGMFFGIERFRNLDGTASGDGFMFYYARGWTTSSTGQAWSQAVFFLNGSTMAPSANAWPFMTSGAAPTSNIIGTTLYPLPVFTGWYTPRLYGPSQMLLVYPRNDMASLGTFALSHYGVSRTWLTAGSTANASAWLGGIGSGSAGLWSFAMRGD